MYLTYLISSMICSWINIDIPHRLPGCCQWYRRLCDIRLEPTGAEVFLGVDWSPQPADLPNHCQPGDGTPGPHARS